MKKIISVIAGLLFLTAFSFPAFSKETKPAVAADSFSSVQMAKAMTVGWNLGNTFDANTETGWGAPVTTQAMIDAVKAAGFKTIRIPVSWSLHVNSSYKIDSAWMARVKEVVDYAVKDDLYIILNVHHDVYSDTEKNYRDDNVTCLKKSNVYGYAVTTDTALQEKSKAYLEKVWSQIAAEFADYSNKLVFEVLNEPRQKDQQHEWWMPDSATAKIYCDVITDYENTCIKAIRSVAGNEKRFIMVPGYAASGTDPKMLGSYTLPSDSAADRLILSAHAYSPNDFAMTGDDWTFEASDEGASLTAIMNYLKTNYTDKGVGVVMGEMSASNKDNTNERVKWMTDYCTKAKAAGIAPVLWDNMVATPDGTLSGKRRINTNGEHHGFLNRKDCTWYFPSIIKAMMDSTGVTDYSIPEYVTLDTQSISWDESKVKTLSAKTWNLGWDNKNFIPANSKAKEGSILKIVTGSAGMSFRMINSDWTYKYNSGSVVNGTVSGDDIVSTDIEVYYVLSAADAAKYKRDGIYFAGGSGTITAVYFEQ